MLSVPDKRQGVGIITGSMSCNSSKVEDNSEWNPIWKGSGVGAQNPIPHQLSLLSIEKEAFLTQGIFATTTDLTSPSHNLQLTPSGLPYQDRRYSVQYSLLCRRHWKSRACFWMKAVASVALVSSCLRELSFFLRYSEKYFCYLKIKNKETSQC